MKLKELRQLIREELQRTDLKIGKEYSIQDPGTGDTNYWEFVGFDGPNNEYLFISRDNSPDGWEISTLRVPKDQINWTLTEY